MLHFQYHRTKELALKAVGFLLLALMGARGSLWSQETQSFSDHN